MSQPLRDDLHGDPGGEARLHGIRSIHCATVSRAGLPVFNSMRIALQTTRAMTSVRMIRPASSGVYPWVRWWQPVHDTCSMAILNTLVRRLTLLSLISSPSRHLRFHELDPLHP